MAYVHRPKHFLAKKNSAFKLGEPVTHDPTHNCLTCDKWSGCKDARKSFSFRCSRHNDASLDGSSSDDPRAFFEPTELPSLPSNFGAEMSNEDEARIDQLITEAIEANNPLPPDIKIQDRDIPQAPNFLTWLTDERFAGGEMPPFPRQIYVGSMLFAEVCPRCTDMEWFERMKVDTSLSRLQERVEFLHNGKCKRCGTDRGELVDEGELANYSELTLIVGQRGTKTSTINQLDGYSLHRYLKLPEPTRVYRQLPQQVFTTTYTSRTFSQVRANVWEPFINIMNNGPWFKNYHKFLAKRGQELGEELAIISEIFVRYRHRNLFISPASPSGQTMRGRTRFTAFIDEISHMPIKTAGGREAAAANAKDTYTALKNSLKTLNNAYKQRFKDGYIDVPKPIMYNASSPLTINDYGMTLLRMSKVSTEMLGLKYKTWEFNPTLPESAFADDFRTRPVESARDYACEPPLGRSTWMTDVESVSQMFNGKRNMYRIEHQVRRTKTKKRVTTAVLHKQMDPDIEWGCVLALDIGSTNNSFAFAIGTVPNDFDLQSYIDQDSETEEASVGMVPINILFAGEVIPRQGAEISQSGLYNQVLSQMCTDLPINLVISDRWQNKKMVQDLEDEFGCEYVEYTLRWEDFENFKQGIFDNEVSLPKLKTDMNDIVATTLDDYPHMFEGKPLEHLAYQFLTVQEARGATVTKGDATDDMFRCIALIHAACQDKEMLEALLEGDDEPTVRPSLGLVLSNKREVSRATASMTPRGHSSPVALMYRKPR